MKMWPWTLAVSLILGWASSEDCSATPLNIDWIRQLGTSAVEVSTGVSLDGHGSVYITGETGGSWQRHSRVDTPMSSLLATICRAVFIGQSSWVLARVMKLRTRSSTVRETSWSLGDTDGSPDQRQVAFVSRIDSTGSVNRTTKFSATQLNVVTYEKSVASDGLGNLFVAGYTPSDRPSYTGNAFVSKLDSGGKLFVDSRVRTDQDDQAYGVAAIRTAMYSSRG